MEEEEKKYKRCNFFKKAVPFISRYNLNIMEEEILKAVLNEEFEILQALKNRLFDLGFELDEDDPRASKIEEEAMKLSAVCNVLIELLE